MAQKVGDDCDGGAEDLTRDMPSRAHNLLTKSPVRHLRNIYDMYKGGNTHPEDHSHRKNHAE